MTKLSGTILVGGSRPEGRGARTAPRINRFRGVWLALLFALVTACAVGPDYRRPEVPAATGFKEQGGWQPTEPADALSRGPWWQIFNDDVLNGLEGQIDISNQNVKAAAAAVEEAQALVREAQAGFFPTLTAGIGRSRERQGAAPARDVNTVNGSVSWPLDIWGQ